MWFSACLACFELVFCCLLRLCVTNLHGFSVCSSVGNLQEAESYRISVCKVSRNWPLPKTIPKEIVLAKNEQGYRIVMMNWIFTH